MLARIPRSAPLTLLLALVLSGIGSLAVAPQAQASDAASFVSSINASRSAAGQPALSSSSTLGSVASSWARSMASSGTLAHNPRLTSQVSGWKYIGENVGVGANVAELHRAFMNSAPHRANILSSHYTQVGIGVATGGGRMWVVEVFRMPTGTSTPAPKPSPKPSPKPTPKPSTRPSTKPSTKPSPKPRPVSRPISRPVARPVAKPVTKPVTHPVAAAAATPTVRQLATGRGTNARTGLGFLTLVWPGGWQLDGVTSALGTVADAWSWVVRTLVEPGATEH